MEGALARSVAAPPAPLRERCFLCAWRPRAGRGDAYTGATFRAKVAHPWAAAPGMPGGTVLKLAWIVLAAVVGAGCGGTTPPLPQKRDAGPHDGATPPPTLMPGEVCTPNSGAALVLTFDPPNVVLAPGKSRPVTVIAEPDLCSPLTLALRMGDSTVAKAPSQ